MICYFGFTLHISWKFHKDSMRDLLMNNSFSAKTTAVLSKTPVLYKKTDIRKNAWVE